MARGDRVNPYLVLFLLLVSLPTAGSQVAVECSKVSTGADGTRLVLETSGSVPHRIFTLQGPDRVVIDLPSAKLIGELPKSGVNDPTLVGVRSGVRDGGDLRIVLDLKHPVRVKSLVSSSDRGAGQRLLIDLIPAGDPAAGRPPATVRHAGSTTGARQAVRRTRQVVIAIDAGHGGKDPGAIGPRGTREKDVTLAIARKLARLVDKEPGMRPFLTRDGDHYVGLRRRILRARQHKADLFISIHADAFRRPDAHGSSVYTLSRGGASSEAAKWLANRENSADLIGGIDLSEAEGMLANVLLDMTQNATIEHSTEVASAVLGQLRGVGAVHKNEVQRAGFVVLKSPDIPSVLVETAFISNQQEEKRLRSATHQQRLAQAILSGIRAYFRRFPPPTYLVEAGGAGAREYVIAKGDTLSGIARRYRVSLSSLQAENDLQDGDYIRVGQVLAIPEGS